MLLLLQQHSKAAETPSSLWTLPTLLGAATSPQTKSQMTL
jgi:hypothetical protein